MEGEVSNMFLKNYEDRLDFLNRHIDKINKAVSDFLGLCRISVVGDEVSVRSVD